MNPVHYFRAAQSVIRVLPEPAGRGVFNAVAAALPVINRSGACQLRRNQARVVPGMTSTEAARLMRAGLRSYMRYYYEALRLPSLAPEQVSARVRLSDGDELRALLATQPAAGALLHAGNWDMAGAWATRELSAVHTVAEKLDPPEMFEFFAEFRASLGMTVHAAGSGSLHKIVDALRGGRGLAPLLADRDITGSGIEARLFGEAIMVAAGPALLAQRLGVPLFPIFSHYEEITGERRRIAGTRWGTCLTIGTPIYASTTPEAPAAERHEDIQRMTQEWIDQCEPFLRAHPEDWHMLQKVFVADLDPERLARSRAKARKAAGLEDQ